MKKILVAEDDAALAGLLSEFLQGEGYEVVTVSNGRECLEEARERRPDLVILDIMMPDMHGFEVCEILRKDQGFKKTKILISSAKSYPVDVRAAKKLGSDSYLAKPFTTDALLEAVRRLIG